MDRPEYTSVQAALAAVPDPRHARGQRYPWPLVLTLTAAALAGGQRRLRAIGQWVGEHTEDVLAILDPPQGRRPSPSTLRRAVQAVDVLALEDRVATFVASLPVTPPVHAGPPPTHPRCRWAGWALDGTAVRAPIGMAPGSTLSAWSARPTPPCLARWPSQSTATRSPPSPGSWLAVPSMGS